MLYIRKCCISLTTKLDMTDKVKKTCQAITSQILKEILWNYKHTLNLCLKNNSAHFEHLTPSMIRNDD